jgi:hypothetical protein
MKSQAKFQLLDGLLCSYKFLKNIIIMDMKLDKVNLSILIKFMKDNLNYKDREIN